MNTAPRTYVYVDAFNLYYGCLKSSPQYKWLNLVELCRLLLPRNDVRQVRYFTAVVSARPNDPDQPVRQQTYLRALQTLPEITIHRGHYLSHDVYMPLAAPPATGPRHAKVIKTEEKGSDVNLATHLLCDAYEGRFDVAVLVTNDSDLPEPVLVVRNRLGRRVGILNPHKQHPSIQLSKAATFIKQIRTGVLAASQFPSTLTDATGTFHRPAKSV